MPDEPTEVIDIHSHLYVPSYLAYLRNRQDPPHVKPVEGVDRFMLFPGDRGVPMGADFMSVERKLSFMDEAGISGSVLSLGNPWLSLETGSHTVDLATQVNDELRQAARLGGGRLWAMGVLPNHDLDSTIRAACKVAEDPELVGLVTGTRICGRELDDPSLAPLWDELAAARLPVLIHPLAGVGGKATRGHGQALTLALSFPFETTVAIARMVLAGVFDARPGLSIIAAHGLGALTHLYGRLVRAVEVDDVATSVSEDLPSGLFADSILFSSASLRQSVEVLGEDKIMFGTDHPFPIADAAAGLRDIEQVAKTRPCARAAIRSTTARHVFNLADHGPHITPPGARTGPDEGNSP